MTTRKPWATSTRTVPGDWTSRKAKVLQRDARTCYACHHPGADECDHIVNVAAGGGHELSNLAAIHSLCPTCGAKCHQTKTQQEARIGMAKKSRKRPIEPHPADTR